MGEAILFWFGLVALASLDADEAVATLKSFSDGWCFWSHDQTWASVDHRRQVSLNGREATLQALGSAGHGAEAGLLKFQKAGRFITDLFSALAGGIDNAHVRHAGVVVSQIRPHVVSGKGAYAHPIRDGALLVASGKFINDSKLTHG